MEPVVSLFEGFSVGGGIEKPREEQDPEETDTTIENDFNEPVKDIIADSLESRSAIEGSPSSVTLEFGDIIEILAPTNPDINEMIAMISYIDNDKLKLINVTNYQHYKLQITSEGTFTDESITQINILSRSKEKGYARQNNLLPRTWIDIHFGGDVPAIITGEITNLEGDMIEITTFPELRTIYINFGYKGLPENIPINSIKIRTKPASVTVATLSTLRGITSASALEEATEEDLGPDASIEYTESGESMITIPKDAVAERNIRDELHDLYMESGDIVFGENLGEIYQLVEIPEKNQRFGIDVQVNDIMDEMLSTIPNSQRTKIVIDNIHLLIERYKQLRELYSKFDKNFNVYDVKMLGASHKPLVDRLEKMDQNFRWLLPAVINRKKIYDVGVSIDSNETIMENLSGSLRGLERSQLAYYKENSKDPLLNYDSICDQAQDFLTPFTQPIQASSYLYTSKINNNIDAVTINMDNFYSTTIDNSEIAKTQYVIQRYNLGFEGLENQTMKTGKTIYMRKNITQNDEITMRSLLMLPEPVIRYSAITLPGTNIIDKANLSHNPFMLYRYLKKSLEINSHSVNDLTRELNYEKMEKDLNKNIFSEVHEFFLGDNAIEEDKFHKFLEVIIPKTRFLIRIIRKYLNNRLSFLDVVKCLEPFAVYSSDITYKQYLEIRYVVKERLEELKIEIEKRSNEFSALRNSKFNVSFVQDSLLRFISEKNEYSDSFFKSYEFLEKYKNKQNNVLLSTAEILQSMNNIDNGELYTIFLKSILISLVTPNQLLDVLDEPRIDEMKDGEKIPSADCGRKYLAKRYTSIRDMQKDNSLDDIYFDKDLDDTPYSIMKKYEKQKKEMLPELFIEFLEQSLIDKHDCPSNLAPELARTLIAGNKKIVDGDYAMLELRPTLPNGVNSDELSEKEKEALELEADIRKRTQYYRRMKNNWVKDNDIADESFLDTNTLFCNVTEKCMKNRTNNVCETIDETGERMKMIARKKILSEFDKRYTVNVDELKKEIENNMNMHLKQIDKQYKLRDIQLLKQSRLAYTIGNSASEIESVQSPHLKLRDLILGQDDFVKKQSDICRFVMQYCRDPLVEQQDEDANWKYCKETNTKLFPFSIFKLAEAFVVGNDYPRKLDIICAKYGIISDDGDSIVDKHSGFVLRKIDFSSEEGFDEAGFRVTTNDILEEDLGAALLETSKKTLEKRVFESETAEIIFNVISTICRNIDIPLVSVEDFVMRTSLEMFDKIIYTEASYKKKSDKQEKEKGKPLQPYKNYRDETRLTIIACNLLIAVQIAIPSLQSKRTFPGCVRSFSGYPLNSGVEDITGIQYLACVLHKTTSSIAIWESIKKYKPDTLTKRMKDIFDNFIMKRSDIMDLYTKKREYMILYPESVSPQEHNISKWLHFMPALVKINLTQNLQTVSSDFEEELKALIRKGSSKQSDSINVLKSKILLFGYGIIEIIQNIVDKKDTLLKSSGNVPFLENGCCNESLELTHPIKYFNSENDHISHYIRNVVSLSKLLNMTKQAYSAPFLFHNEFTGIRHSTIYSNNLDDPSLIYSAILHYCNFDKELPIPEKFKNICTEKPLGYKPEWSILEKIEFLKKNAMQYNVDNLLQLMNIVNIDNIVDSSQPEPFTRLDVIKDVIENLDMENSNIVDEPLRKLLFSLFESHKPKTMSYDISNELNNLQNYLIKANKDMYREIMDFFGRYGNLSDSKYGKLHDFLKNICVWKLDKSMKESGLYYDSGLYTITQFIQNAVQAMSKTYPNILLNDVGFYKKIHSHWGFSDRHNSVLSQFINKYYEKLETFKEDRIIYRLLMEVGQRLTSLNTFLQNLPIHTEMVKDFGNNVEGEQIRSFYYILDKSTIYMLYSYCFYSVLYEYINCTNDVDLLRADVEEIKRSKRTEINNMNNMSNQIGGQDTDLGEELLDRNIDFNEVEIRVGNTEELKNRVAALLLCFLDVEEDNKKTIDLSYEDIQQKVRRNKDIERKSVIDRLTQMSIEQRKVEDSLKKYRLEHWNVGQQKGLYEYDATAYDRELDQMLFDREGEVDMGEVLDIAQLDNLERINEENLERIDYGRNAINAGIINVEDGEINGDYYYNDGEEGDFPEDT
jgi:hypothetical protein